MTQTVSRTQKVEMPRGNETASYRPKVECPVSVNTMRPNQGPMQPVGPRRQRFGLNEGGLQQRLRGLGSGQGFRAVKGRIGLFCP